MRKAIQEKNDSCKRLALIAAFQMTTYGCVIGRTSKPFNPLLGETYELVTPHYKFLAEQVQHSPPIVAFSYEGEGYRQWGHNEMLSSFKGGSLEFRATGLKYIQILGSEDEVITIKRPESSANNLIMG